MTTPPSEKLLPCACSGQVAHLIRDEEESVIQCILCNNIIGVESLWNDRQEAHRVITIMREALLFAQPCVKPMCIQLVDTSIANALAEADKLLEGK